MFAHVCMHVRSGETFPKSSFIRSSCSLLSFFSALQSHGYVCMQKRGPQTWRHKSIERTDLWPRNIVRLFWNLLWWQNCPYAYRVVPSQTNKERMRKIVCGVWKCWQHHLIFLEYSVLLKRISSFFLFPCWLHLVDCRATLMCKYFLRYLLTIQILQLRGVRRGVRFHITYVLAQKRGNFF